MHQLVSAQGFAIKTFVQWTLFCCSYWLAQGFDPYGFVQKQNRAPAHDFMALGALIECQGQWQQHAELNVLRRFSLASRNFELLSHKQRLICRFSTLFSHFALEYGQVWSALEYGCDSSWGQSGIPQRLQRMIKIGRDFQSLYAPSPMFEVPTMS